MIATDFDRSDFSNENITEYQKIVAALHSNAHNEISATGGSRNI
jgi:hypothetical protein